MSQLKRFSGGAIAPLLGRGFRSWWLTLPLQVFALVVLGVFGTSAYAVTLVIAIALVARSLSPGLHLVEATLAQLVKDNLTYPWLIVDTGHRQPRGIAALKISACMAGATSQAGAAPGVLFVVGPHRWGIRTWYRMEHRTAFGGEELATGEWIVAGGRGFATRGLSRLVMDISEVRPGDIFSRQDGVVCVETTGVGRPSLAALRAAALSVAALASAAMLAGRDVVSELEVVRTLPRALALNLRSDPTFVVDPWSTSAKIVDSVRNAEPQGKASARHAPIHTTPAPFVEGFGSEPEVDAVERLRHVDAQLADEAKRTRERERLVGRDLELRVRPYSVADGVLSCLMIPAVLILMMVFYAVSQLAAFVEGSVSSTLAAIGLSSFSLWLVPGILVWVRSRVALRRAAPRRAELPAAFAEVASWTSTIGRWVRAEIEAGAPLTPALVRCAEWVARHEGALGHDGGYRGVQAARKGTTSG